MTQLVGILNLSEDSFSDSGANLDARSALALAHRMVSDGAAIVDVGAESTHPDARDVSEEEETARLTPVIETLVRHGLAVSVDTHKPAVIRHVIGLGTQYINDVTALQDRESVAAVRDSAAKVIIMHSRAPVARAVRAQHRTAPDPSGAGLISGDLEDPVPQIVAFLNARLASLEAAGIVRSRVIVDPGMGFFLGSDPAPSIAVLRRLSAIRAIGQPVFICTSRKSFIGSLLGRPVHERGPGTLASEVWAYLQGVDYIRTHDVRALSGAIKLLRAIQEG